MIYKDNSPFKIVIKVRKESGGREQKRLEKDGVLSFGP